MKKYKIKRKTIFINIITIILFYSFFTFIFVHYIGVGRTNNIYLLGMLLAGLVFFIYLALTDLKASVSLSDKGIIFERYGRQVSLSWKAIQRVEYKVMIYSKRAVRLVIHSRFKPIFIDPSFENYLELWSSIVTKYSAVREAPCIDKELLDLVNMDKDVE